MKVKVFPSKILLFGEFGIILNSMGLAMPFDLYHGRLSMRDRAPRDTSLEKLCNELFLMRENGELPFEMDLNRFDVDIKNGLFFNSTIPVGFGLGSSGALVAAIYDRYSGIETDKLVLKEHLGTLESYYHGSSSGVDPLISYLNQSILIKGDGDLRTVEIPDLSQGTRAIFLINTGISRKTSPLVDIFLKNCEDSFYMSKCNKVLLPITNNCIESFMSGDFDSLYEFYRELSDFQFRHFAPMIPGGLSELWKEGLKSCDYYLKLCGAGGGGFLMVMTSDYEKTTEIMDEFEQNVLFRF